MLKIHAELQLLYSIRQMLRLQPSSIQLTCSQSLAHEGLYVEEQAAGAECKAIADVVPGITTDTRHGSTAQDRIRVSMCSLPVLGHHTVHSNIRSECNRTWL